MTFEQAIDRLREKYAEAQTVEYVTNPLAWALYQVWRESEARK